MGDRFRKQSRFYRVPRDGRMLKQALKETEYGLNQNQRTCDQPLESGNLLRGKSMVSMYSWSSKRSYKNGFVWHDLSEDDYIHPVHGLEYVLKGSEILHPQPASHIHECKVYNAEPERQLDGKCVGGWCGCIHSKSQTEDEETQ
ncbi:hypothetical protein QQ045_021537 [Rhodiola kirilowii]